MKKKIKTVVVVEVPLLLPRAEDSEVRRLLHPQPPLAIPSRSWSQPRVGFLAHQLLGHRIYFTGA